jgi:type II secretory pathway component PulF
MLVTIGILILIVYIVLGVAKPAIAILTCPLICVMFGIIATSERSEAIILSPVIFLATIIAVLFSKDPQGKSWPRTLAKCILIALIVFGTVIGCFAAGAIGVIGLVFLATASAGLISYHLASRRARAAEVISTIGSVIRQNLPLTMALETACAGRTDKTSRILAKVNKWLVQGYSLSDSLRLGFPSCPGHAVAMIAAAERVSQLPQALASIEADMVTKADETRRIRPVHPVYPVIVLLLVFIIVLGLMKFVIPNFSSVLQEVCDGRSLPPPTRILMNATSFIAQDASILVGIALIALLVMSLPVALRAKYRPRRPDKPYLVSRVADFIKWHLPIVHWFERNYSLAAICSMLKLSLSAGGTVNEAVANAIGVDVNNRFRLRLKKWLSAIESGRSVSESARNTGIGDSIAWAFDTDVNQGNTINILDTLEYFYRTNYSYRVNLARFILWPCTTIALGLFVGFVVYAIMSPMVAIVSHLSTSIVP